MLRRFCLLGGMGLLLALAPSARAGAPLLTAPGARITDAAVRADQAVFDDCQARITALVGAGANAYHVAKAQAWLDFALDEYAENDRTGITEAALRQAVGLVLQLEAGAPEISMDTPLVGDAVRVRDDLWQAAARLKAREGFGAVAPLVAQLEVALVWAGHEQAELGWRHARDVLRRADALAQRAEQCLAAQAPRIAAPPPVTGEATGPLTAVPLGTPTVSAAAGATVSHDAPAAFSLGATRVTWTARDAQGRIATDVQLVTVLDRTPPQLAPPGAVAAEAAAPYGTGVDVGVATAHDLVDPAPVIAHDAPARFPLGTTRVTWTARDASGNTSTAEQVVTISDTRPPTLAAPPDLRIEATAPEGAVVDLGTPRCHDAVDPAPVVRSDAPIRFPLGPTLVTWTAIDHAGNMATALQRVVVVDTTPPDLTPPPTLTVEATGPGGADADLSAPVARDLVDPAPAVRHDAPATFPLGATRVTWTARDAAGNTRTAVQLVTVTDTTPPVLRVPADIVVEAIGAATPIDIGVATATDIVDPRPLVAHDGPDTYPLGETVVTWTARDRAGHRAAATQRVTVRDTTAPVFPPLPDVVAELGAPVVLPTPTATDVVDPRPLVRGDAPAGFPLGETRVTWTATDASGNRSTTAQRVRVVDRTPPVLRTPRPLTVEATGPDGAEVALDPPDATDNDGPPRVRADAPARFPLGVTRVTWTARDREGNTSTVEQTVTVVDTVAPTLAPPPDVTTEAAGPDGTAVMLGAPTVSDRVDRSVIVRDDAPARFPLGRTRVTWTARDASGNVATAVQTVTVVDTTPPNLQAPEAMAIVAPSPEGVRLALTPPRASDLVDPRPTVTSDAPALFPVGTTVVRWTARDASGNATMREQPVTVAPPARPVGPPHLVAPPDITVEVADPAGTPVRLGAPTAGDADGGPVDVTNDAPVRFPLGLSRVTWTARGRDGQTTHAVQQVLVVDTRAPSLAAPADLTVEATSPAGAWVNPGVATVRDAGDANPLVTNDAPAVCPLGMTTVTWTARDAVGNAATATQRITVVDTTPPVVQPPVDRTIEATGPDGARADAGEATTTDLVDRHPIVRHDAPAVFPLGETTVTWTARDAAGNASRAQQRITVRDTTAPVLAAPRDVFATASSMAGTSVALGTPVVVDLVDAAPTVTHDAPERFPLGLTQVTWTARDAAGNTATAVQQVTVKPIVVPHTVHFAFDKDDLAPATIAILDEIVAVLRAHPTITVTMSGHTDIRGSNTYNLALSERRARAVQRYLIAAGIAAARVAYVAVGASKPLAPGNTPVAHARNRAVILTYAGATVPMLVEEQDRDLQY